MALPSVAVLHNNDYEAYAPGSPSYESDAGVRDTAEAVLAALLRLGHEAWIATVSKEVSELGAALDRRPADLVFNLVESVGGDAGREPEIPEFLERRGQRYTGNPGPVLRVAQAKDEARRRLAAAGVPIPRGCVVERGAPAPELGALGLEFPVFVKPARTDASIGIDQASLARDARGLAAKLAQLSEILPGPYLIEEYLPGREVNVAIFPEPERGHLVATEIDFSACEGVAPIVTYDCKWRPGTPDYAARSVPCAGRTPEAEIRAAQALARRAFLAIGGTGYGRVDLRLGADGAPRAIDVNPNPDIHPEAGLSIAAGSIGLTYDALIAAFVEAACARRGA